MGSMTINPPISWVVMPQAFASAGSHVLTHRGKVERSCEDLEVQ